MLGSTTQTTTFTQFTVFFAWGLQECFQRFEHNLFNLLNLFDVRNALDICVVVWSCGRVGSEDLRHMATWFPL